VIDRGGKRNIAVGDMTGDGCDDHRGARRGIVCRDERTGAADWRIEFNALYHQGNGNHIFMNSSDETRIMITVFGPGERRLAWCDFIPRAPRECQRSPEVAPDGGQTVFSFNAADITASPVFADK